MGSDYADYRKDIIAKRFMEFWNTTPIKETMKKIESERNKNYYLDILQQIEAKT